MLSEISILKISLGMTGAILIVLGLYLKKTFAPENRRIFLSRLIISSLLPILLLLILAVIHYQSSQAIPALDFLTPTFHVIFKLGEIIQSRFTDWKLSLQFLLPVLSIILSVLIIIFKRKNGRKAAMLILAVGAALSGHLLIYGHDYQAGGIMIALGIGLMIVCARMREHYSPASLPSPRSSRVILAIILLGGFILRFYHLDIFPREFLNYEASDGLAALQVLKKDPVIIQTLFEFFDRPIMDSYTCPFTVLPVAFLFSIFGSSIVILRSVPAFYGVLTIGMLYLLGKTLYSKWTGLTAAFLLAVSPWHLTASRAGLFLNLAPLYALVLLYFLYRAVESGKIRYYLAGALIICIYWLFYLVVKVLLLVFLLMILYCLLSQRGFTKKNWVGLLGFGLGLILFIYLAGDTPQHWFLSLGRQSENTIWRLRMSLFGGYLGPETQEKFMSLPSHLATLKLFISNIKYFFIDLYTCSRHEFLINNRAPLVNTFLLIFWPLGFAYCMAHWKEKQYFLLAAWFLVGTIPQLLFMPAVGRAAPRHLLIAQPALYLLIALPLGLLFGNIRRIQNHLIRFGIIIIVIFSSLAFAAVNITSYFKGPMYPYLVWRNRRDSARHIAHLLDHHYLYIIQFPGPIYLTTRPIDFITYPHIGYLHYFLGETNSIIRPGEPQADERYMYLPLQGTRVTWLPDTENFPCREVIFAYEDPALTGTLESTYPGGHLELVANDEEETILHLYYPESEDATH